MLTATAILRKEHDAILRMLEVADEVSRQLTSDQRVAVETLNGLLEFFRLFADRRHHRKEEDLLFPWLEKKGLARAGGPIGVMLSEHEQGRGLVKQMAEAADAYANGAAGAGRRWAHAAGQYSALLRQHIDKENNVLFIMTENLLTAAEQSELGAAFEQADQEETGAGAPGRLQALMDKLAAEILPG
jgi:hemerythrin-like domain-containing protein